MYLTKFDRNLTLLWSNLLSVTYSGVGVALTKDKDENIIAVGNDNSTVIIRKVDANGSNVWVTQIGTVKSDIVTDVAIDSNDNTIMP